MLGRHVRPPGVNTLGLVAAVLARLQREGVPCHVSGGWAEELLGLRPPGPHGDIDLVHLAPDFVAVDRALARGFLGGEIVLKRFPHKRAFLVGGICCEILLIDQTGEPPMTRFWGDVPFFWRRPLLEPDGAGHGDPISVLSRPNLLHQRAHHRSTQPHRWRTFLHGAAVTGSWV
jgi:hypothetical protein